MALPAEVWFVVPLIGVLSAAVLPFVSPVSLARAARTLALAIAAAASLSLFLLLAPSQDAGPTARLVWEWSKVGGPAANAGFRIDALAVTAAAVAVLVFASSLATASGHGLLRALVLVQTIVLLTLAAADDLVVGAVAAGAVAAASAAVGLMVARPAAAARLAALLALGVQAFVAAALLVGRYGIRSFDLDEVPAAAITPEVLAMMALGGALFCGLYPFVPWRYAESAPAEPPLSALRGALVFPTGVAGTLFALRLISASDTPPASLPLPEVSGEVRVLLAVLILAIAGESLRRARRSAWGARALTVAGLLALIGGYPGLRWGDLVGALALLTVAYASVASAAVPEEWRVARFDARLATLWAAIILGTPLALAGALFALLAGSLSLALETVELPQAAAPAARVAARVLAVSGPFVSLAGLPGAAHPSSAAIAAVTLLWAGILEGAHAVRAAQHEDWHPLRVRASYALGAVALSFLLALASGGALVRAARDVFPASIASPQDAAIAAAALGVALIAAALVALSELVGLPSLSRVEPIVGRLLEASDPVPGALLLYRFTVAVSSGVARTFTLFEERAGVWVATALIAIALFWAARS